jgi:hypothetical protein
MALIPATEARLFQMEKSTKESAKMAKRTVVVGFYIQMDLFRSENGKMRNSLMVPKTKSDSHSMLTLILHENHTGYSKT